MADFKSNRIRKQSFYEKIVIAGGVVEVTAYEKLNVTGNGGKREGEGEQREENYKQTQRKRRSLIRQLITMNFDNKSKFITLTFRDTEKFDITDVKACNKAFKAFIRKLKTEYSNLQYLAVIEFQDKNGRGAVHYHMLSNLPFIEKERLSDIWGNGFVQINSISKVDNVGAYVVKYMQKDIDDTRLQGLKAYNATRGLKKPIVYTSWKAGDKRGYQEQKSLLDRETPSYSAKYESDITGDIIYNQYNFNRKTSP